MYTIFLVLGGLWIVQGANYQRYDESTRFPLDTTSQNKYSQNVNYGDELSIFSEGKPYSSYGVDSSTPRYDNAGPGSAYYPGGGRYAPGYGQGYGKGYGQNYDQGYGQGYGQNFGQSYSSYELPFVRNGRDYCINRVPQTGIWVDRLMGMWYGVEVVQHLAGDSTPNYERTCIVVHISEPKDRIPTNKQLHHVEALNARFRQMYRQLRLVWDEQGDTVEYALYFTNDSAGYWQAFDHQNGSMAQRSTYQQFTGTVQVLKAVNDHLVLNFCQEAANGKPAELYSVLFSRDARTMTSWEVESVHSLLQNKNLSVASRRMVCGNGAGRPYYSFLFTFLTGLFACILCSS